jgi:hypothetical protein
MGSQLLRLIFSVSYIIDNDMICSFLLKRYLVSLTIFIFKAMIIIPMIFLHRKSFLGNESYGSLKESTRMELISTGGSSINDDYLPDYEESEDD